LLISKRSGPVLIVTFWRTKYNKKWSISTLRETYINWNWLGQAWGRFRDVLYEMNVLYQMWSIVDLKMLLKLASKCWFVDLNEICWCASFVCWPKLVWFCIYYEVFLKYLCEHPRVRLIVWKLMCWLCLHPRVRLKFNVRIFKNELWRIFLLPDIKLVEIWRWRSSLFFSMVLMLQRCVVFAEDDAKDLLIEALILWNCRQNDKRNLEKICLLSELENMFLILTPGIIQTPLWRTFDGGSPEDSMDDREVDSR